MPGKNDFPEDMDFMINNLDLLLDAETDGQDPSSGPEPEPEPEPEEDGFAEELMLDAEAWGIPDDTEPDLELPDVSEPVPLEAEIKKPARKPEPKPAARPQKAKEPVSAIPDRMMTPEEIAALLEDL